jgi:hypothetical protein
MGRSMVALISGRLGAARRTSGAGDVGYKRDSDAGEGLESDFVGAVDASWSPVPGGIVGATRAVRRGFSDWTGSGRRATPGAGAWDEVDPPSRLNVAKPFEELVTVAGTFTASSVAPESERAGLGGETGAIRFSVVGTAVGPALAVTTASRSEWRGLSCGWSASGETTICTPGFAGPTEDFTTGAAGGEEMVSASTKAFVVDSADEDDKPGSDALAGLAGADGSGGMLGCGTTTGLASWMRGRGTTVSSVRGGSGRDDRVGGRKVLEDGSAAGACALEGSASATKTSSEDRGGGEAGSRSIRRLTRT